MESPTSRIAASTSERTFWIRRDETEAAWQWVDAILDGWQQSRQAPRSYAAGTWGPTAAVALAERHGHSWRE